MSESTDLIDELLRAAFGTGNEAVVETVVENVARVEVLDCQQHGEHTFEVWMGSPSSWSGGDLEAIEALFTVREIGVYGDPALRGTEEGNSLDGALHAVLRIKNVY